MTSMCQICKQNYTEDLIVGVGDNERFNTNETISVVCSNCYEKHQCEGCDDWHTHKNMCEECGECAEPSSHHRCCECETWNEECYDCDTPMTEKKLTEEEFDEYPDRSIGYGKDGEWRCGNCRSNEEESTCRDCDRSMSQLDANDIEMEDRGKYSTCLDCEDERKSHIDNDCKHCEGNTVGRHAMDVGTKGNDICYSCDVNQAMAEEYGDRCSYCDTIKLMDSTERENTDPKPVMYKGEWICYACYDEADKCGCGCEGPTMCEPEEEDISHLTDKEYISHLEKKVEELEGKCGK